MYESIAFYHNETDIVKEVGEFVNAFSFIDATCTIKKKGFKYYEVIVDEYSQKHLFMSDRGLIEERLRGVDVNTIYFNYVPSLTVLQEAYIRTQMNNGAVVIQ